jgi:hypothetical protein
LTPLPHTKEAAEDAAPAEEAREDEDELREDDDDEAPGTAHWQFTQD